MSNTVTPPSLDLRIQTLSERQAATRREHVDQLVPDAEALAGESEQAEAAAVLARDAAVREFNSRYSARERALARLPGTQPADLGRAELVAPAEARLATARTTAARARALRDSIRTEAQPVGVRTSYSSGICGVYNEATGKVEWREQFGRGVAGAYDPATRRVRWESHFGAIDLIRDPTTGRIERGTGVSGVAGYVDPRTQRARFETAVHGHAVVVDRQGNIHRQNNVSGAIVGWLDPASGEPKFQSGRFNDGAAVVYRDGNTYRNDCSFYDDDG